MKIYIKKIQLSKFYIRLSELAHFFLYAVFLMFMLLIPFSFFGVYFNIDIEHKIVWVLTLYHTYVITYIIALIYVGLFKFDFFYFDKFKSIKKYMRVPLLKKINITFSLTGTISSLILLCLFLFYHFQSGVSLTMDSFSIIGVVLATLSLFYSTYFNQKTDLQQYKEESFQNSLKNSLEFVIDDNKAIKKSVNSIQSHIKSNPRNKRKTSNRGF
ncbi:hypothetical protein [Paraliobacillus sp. X-1268]|uniref:hypothetical protein n=1 Tax=Paraliobacillus sp. X-1268 TaxID=2213193 RepID=UPI000E3C39D4|nr:hypothetical protein [Paraliobacillus sp. X-1268]